MPLQMADRNKSVAELAGDALREIALLAAVFFMLDNLMQARIDKSAAYPISVDVYVLLGCIFVWVIGVLFEVCRHSGD
jgi:hypothetical protein